MKRILTVTIACGVLFILIWQSVSGVLTSIRVSHANEQTHIFDEMIEKATVASRQDPPNVRAAVSYLKYVNQYYPSGTKQTTGSQLDRIVERSRLNAERQIKDILRAATGSDFGEDVNDWVRALDAGSASR
jgi:hypothetical protein